MLGIAAALGSAAAWALGAVLFKRLSVTASPMALTLSKGVISLVLLAAVLPFVAAGELSRRELLLLVGSGVLGIAAGDTLFFAALSCLSPHVCIVYMMLGQVVTAVAACVFLGERHPLAVWAGLGLVMSGVYLVLRSSLEKEGEAGQTRLRGALFGLCAVLCMSASYIIARPALDSVSTLWATFIRLAAGTAVMALLGLVTGSVRGWLQPFRRAAGALPLVRATLVVTFGGFWLSMVAMKYAGVVVANTLGSLEPMFVLPFTWFLLRERIRGIEVVGTVTAVVGVLVVTLLNG
jgi:drug/metabolite transporter (DMT)-like permease